MRFPFFKTQKPETKETIKTVSATPPAASSNKLGATQRIPVGVLSAPRLGKAVTPPAATAAKPAPAAPANGPTVTLRVTALSSQIPTQVFSPQGQANIVGAKVSIPVHVILPQLASGKVSIKLGELLTFFPAVLLRSPLPPFPDQQVVVLPLEDVIPAIPPDMLSVAYESVISADDPELGKLPTLIDDESLAAHRRTRSNPSLAETQPVRRLADELKPEPKAEPAPAPKAEVKLEPVKPAPVAVPARSNGTAPKSIAISLRALVPALPDSIFNCSRSELTAKIATAKPIHLPAEPIIPQLRTGGVRLAVSIIASLLPAELLANPLPNLDGVMVALPLAEIIPQISPTLFTDHLREPSQVEADTDPDIPDPFHEKNAAPKFAPAPEPVTEELAIETAALEDENFEIFSEKPAPVAPLISAKATVPIHLPPVAPPPEPVVAPEPVAEIKPVEPIIEEIPVQAPEPVAEIAANDTVVDEVQEVVAEPVAEIKPSETVVEDTHDIWPEPVAEVKPAEPVAPTPAPVPAPVVFEPVAEATPPTPVAPVAPATADPAYADADLAEEEETGTLPIAAKLETPAEGVAPADERKFLVDLNRCTAEDLMAIPGIGRALAQRIIDFRNVRGSFSSVEELRQVPGIGRKTFRALAGVQPRALNRLLGAPHDGELTLQEIVRLTGRLPGIAGCMLALSDGLFLTGQLPDHLDQNTISVFAPQLFKKVGRYSRLLYWRT